MASLSFNCQKLTSTYFDNRILKKIEFYIDTFNTETWHVSVQGANTRLATVKDNLAMTNINWTTWAKGRLNTVTKIFLWKVVLKCFFFQLGWQATIFVEPLKLSVSGFKARLDLLSALAGM